MLDRENVIAWLTEISLRPCDFATDYFDAYETEHLANEALEICEAAKVFNEQRNDALALLKEQEAVEPITQSSVYDPDTWFYVCGSCKKSVIDRGDKFCRWCGKPVLWEGR